MHWRNDLQDPKENDRIKIEKKKRTAVEKAKL